MKFQAQITIVLMGLLFLIDNCKCKCDHLQWHAIFLLNSKKLLKLNILHKQVVQFGVIVVHQQLQDVLKTFIGVVLVFGANIVPKIMIFV